MAYGYYYDLPVDGAELFTVVALPAKAGKFPVVVCRSPYVDARQEITKDELVARQLAQCEGWLSGGYAIVDQHCRGRGHSTGDCIPYICEREDSLALHDWIREQPFYNGELYLMGGSYTSSVHYAAAPFADDIKGAVLEVQDSERYNICYRNGFLKVGLHGGWYVGMYKKKSIPDKNYSGADSFLTLPLSDFSKTVFGESAADFDELIKNPRRDSPFWNTRFGGADARDAVKNAKCPILLRTGFYDIYTGGVMDMWNAMSPETKAKSALIVTANDHGDHHKETCERFEGSRAAEAFPGYAKRWFDYIRGMADKPPVEQGKVTYYRLYENDWRSEDTIASDNFIMLRMGSGCVSYTYDPADPPEFPSGLSANFGGSCYENAPGTRPDVITVYSAPFEKDVFVKGKMSASLTVSSDCEDTCFYVRLSLEKSGGDFGLRDDIRSLCFELGDYTPGTYVKLDFAFDEHAFRIAKGERLRMDVASAAKGQYVRHTNQKGLYSEQTETKIARNTVDFDRSCLKLPIE